MITFLEGSYSCLACRMLVEPYSDGTPVSGCWNCIQKKREEYLKADRQKDRRLRAIAKTYDIDVLALARQLAKLPVFKDTPYSVGRVRVKVSYAASRGGGHGSRSGILVRVSPGVDVAHIMETTLHELVHAALPRSNNHDERFRLTLARAAREAWGVVIDPNVRQHSSRIKAYVLDDRIEAVLRYELGEGRVTYPKKQPVAKKSRAELSVALVEKRAAHAVKMLVRAEKRAKTAQRSLTKWRTKVRYYEKVAAKRGGA